MGRSGVRAGDALGRPNKSDLMIWRRGVGMRCESIDAGGLGRVGMGACKRIEGVEGVEGVSRGDAVESGVLVDEDDSDADVASMKGVAAGVGMGTTSCLGDGVSEMDRSASDTEAEPAGSGSGKHSRLEWLQRGQIQFRERAASRFRSALGYSMAPTPAAAVPFSGKNPCSPMMAVRTPQAGCQSSS